MSTTTETRTRAPASIPGEEVAGPPALRVDGLVKRYGQRVAVDHLSFEVPAGAVAGFIGPNGAGKTTTMAMLLGLVRPTGGAGSVLGHPLDHPAAYLGRVGALVEGPALWPSLTGEENLRALAALGGHDPARIPAVLDLVGLADRGGDRFGRYSLGMKQRLGIAAALLGDPELLVLDEPTNGLDPAGINEMRQLIGRVGGGDRTVLVSSHILSELEQVCDWLVVIDQGALLYQGPAAGFLGQATPWLVVAPERDRDLAQLTELVHGAGLAGERDGSTVTIPVPDGDPRSVAAHLNRVAAGAGITLAELHVQRPNLESHYLHVIQGQGQGADR